MALGVMLVVAVLSIHGVVSQSFHNNSSLGYNMIVGPKGGKEQLVLNTVYYLSAPVENIPYTFYLEFLERGERDKLLTESFDAKATLAVRDSLQLLALTDNSGVAGLVQPLAAGRAAEAPVPDVQESKAPPVEFGRNGKYGQFTELAIPVCLGDYFDRFRVVGTTPTLFNELVYDIENNRKFEFAQGRTEWKSKENGFFEAVVGSTARDGGEARRRNRPRPRRSRGARARPQVHGCRHPRAERHAQRPGGLRQHGRLLPDGRPRQAARREGAWGGGGSRL
jgi:putative ABC transport system permease protein